MQFSLFPMTETVVETKQGEKPTFEPPYSKEYCIKEILNEEYLWDMRCWERDRYSYTTQEIAVHLKQWLADKEAGICSYNCGHCLWCISLMLEMKWASLEQIAVYVGRNTKVKYSHQISSWNLPREEQGV